jgi:hypothetical protein
MANSIVPDIRDLTAGAKVELTENELRIGAGHGTDRRIEAIRDGRKHRNGSPPKSAMWGNDIEGVCGEMGVCKFLGVYWSGAGSLRAPDVVGKFGRLEVRTAQPGGCLIVQPSDDDDARFILVIGFAPTYWLVGWLWGRDAKRQEWWRNPGTGRPAYFVPQAALNSIDVLAEAIPF